MKTYSEAIALIGEMYPDNAEARLVCTQYLLTLQQKGFISLEHAAKMVGENQFIHWVDGELEIAALKEQIEKLKAERDAVNMKENIIIISYSQNVSSPNGYDVETASWQKGSSPYEEVLKVLAIAMQKVAEKVKDNKKETR